MPRADRKTCLICRRHCDEVGPISHAGRCGDCGAARLAENVIGLHTMTGPAVPRWRLGMVRSAGGFTREEVEAMLDAVRRGA